MCIMNVIMVLSGGSGTRFGTDLPKQYHLLMGKPVIEYVLDACRLSKCADEIIVVASKKYEKKLREKYKCTVVVGGKERSNSVKNGIDYINNEFNCDKLVIVDAVTPLITEEQIDKYFSLLDNYDHVETGLNIVTGMRRVDGKQAIRDDYYLVCGPEAFRFQLFYDNFSDQNLPTTMFLPQLPSGSKTYVCYDYPYSMKLTYLFDMRIAEALMEHVILRPKEEKALLTVENWVANNSQKRVETQEWFRKLPEYFYMLRQRWGIVQYKLNTESLSSVVYEAVSTKHGNVIVKFDPPMLGRYLGEKNYYLHSSDKYMAKLIDYDDEYNALLLEQIFPGRQMRFSQDEKRLIEFFDCVIENTKKMSVLENDVYVRFIDIFNTYERNSGYYNFELTLRKQLTNVARRVFNSKLDKEEQYFIHFDLHSKNILEAGDCYKAIDGIGIVGPLEFELVRMAIVDSMYDRNNTKRIIKSRIKLALRYFTTEQISCALFVLWVYLTNQHVFSLDDDFDMAKWDIECIKEFFNVDELLNNDCVAPRLAQEFFE